MDAIAFFTTRLAFQTDVSDVQAALAARKPDEDGEFVLIDTRSRVAWEQGHIPGAVHLPTAELATAELDPLIPLVTYCWGPGCNGATRAALVLARRGLTVREMIGGLEYWVREGFPVRTKEGDVGQHPDPLTAPSCGC